MFLSVFFIATIFKNVCFSTYQIVTWLPFNKLKTALQKLEIMLNIIPGGLKCLAQQWHKSVFFFYFVSVYVLFCYYFIVCMP